MTVVIIDVNDETPEFVMSTLEDLSVREHEDVGEEITIVRATDGDLDDQGDSLIFSVR